jgi:hypothetical protein
MPRKFTPTQNYSLHLHIGLGLEYILRIWPKLESFLHFGLGLESILALWPISHW